MKRLGEPTVHAFSIPTGKDLYEELSVLVGKRKIKAGFITCIGALQKAKVAFYNQKTHEYEEHEMNEACEIVACTGNITLKEGKPFVHIHLVVSDKTGRAFGGHALPGCKVFACEGFIFSFYGKVERALDEATGLHLWKL
ncbi:MAG: PPC domain-containing DNA-binding protein [bacterium]